MSEKNQTFFENLDITVTSLRQAREVIEVNRQTKNVVCLVGAAGIGKTHIVKQVAEARKPTRPFVWKGVEWKESVPIKVLYLAHMQPEDIGVPYPSMSRRQEKIREMNSVLQLCEGVEDNDTAQELYHYAKKELSVLMNMLKEDVQENSFEFLIEKQLLDLPPEGILFLDEWNRADKSVIKAFFTLLEDREVHGVPVIKDGVQIVAAMNPSDGTYAVNEAEKDHAFRRRLCFVPVVVNNSTWLDYAKDKFHPYVVGFIRAMPTSLYDTTLRDAGKLFPCPATWEKVSTLLMCAERDNIKLDSVGVEYTIAGCIGNSWTKPFLEYIKNEESLINPEDILKHYTDKSAVRKKVRKLVEANRNDLLNELCTGVASIIVDEMPDAIKTAPCLGRFLGDLSSDMAVNMMTVGMSVNAHKDVLGSNVTAYKSYITALSVELSQLECYQKLFEGISNAMQNIRTKMSDTTLDPLA